MCGVCVYVGGGVILDHTEQRTVLGSLGTLENSAAGAGFNRQVRSKDTFGSSPVDIAAKDATGVETWPFPSCLSAIKSIYQHNSSKLDLK